MSEKASVKDWPPERIISLSGDIKAISATLLERALTKLPRRGSRRPLFLIINSEGGDFYAALKIRGLLKRYERSLITVVYGRAYSGALMILQSGARRLMTKQSILRFHQANHNFLKDETLNAEDISSLMKQLNGIDAIQKTIYIERATSISTPSLKKFHILFGKQAYLRYPQAKNIRLVDGVIPQPKSLDALRGYLLSHETSDAFLEALREWSKWY